MEPVPAQSCPVSSGPSSFPPPAAVTSSSSPPNLAPAAAPTVCALAQAAAPSFSPSAAAAAPVVAFAPIPAANGAGGSADAPIVAKWASIAQRISMAGITVIQISFGAGAPAADLTLSSRGWPPNGAKKSRRRRGRKPGRKTNDAGPRPEDKDPGAGSTGGGD
ncbi:hypothetical protein CEP54_004343 [Fusarium duplospermum]|uniref:Uncharacterized protein n=1 Tax=Fusarium duplospermum TaxID=1325734 RepID=A0A428QIW6_9HYPO|nr:hypothetical protein CEP54_004343 [Fusarium duplospermum]